MPQITLVTIAQVEELLDHQLFKATIGVNGTNSTSSTITSTGGGGGSNFAGAAGNGGSGGGPRYTDSPGLAVTSPGNSRL